MYSFNKHMIVITGATGALGSEVARQFADAQASTILIARDKGKLAQLLESFPNPERHQVFSCDLTSDAEVADLFEQIAVDHSQIHGLINIAGGFSMGTKVHDLSVNQFNAMFHLNFSSTLNTCRHALRNMVQHNFGRIVNVSARAALEGKATMAPYCISKRAVLTLTESLAAEHKHDGIRINCILPGTIDTANNREDMPDADHSKWVAPADLANTIMYLYSDQSAAINGACIPVYGQS